MLAYYFDIPSLNPAEAYSFSVKFVFEKNENKQKRGRAWLPFTNFEWCRLVPSSMWTINQSETPWTRFPTHAPSPIKNLMLKKFELKFGEKRRKKGMKAVKAVGFKAFIIIFIMYVW